MTTAVRTLSKPIQSVVSKPLGHKVGKRWDAKPIRRILDRKTLEVVGWLYEWNTGELLPMWKSGACNDFIYD